MQQPRREATAVNTAPGRSQDLFGKWQAAILKAEQNRPKLRLVSDG
jgi:hypothetical protein